MIRWTAPSLLIVIAAAAIPYALSRPDGPSAPEAPGELVLPCCPASSSGGAPAAFSGLLTSFGGGAARPAIPQEEGGAEEGDGAESEAPGAADAAKPAESTGAPAAPEVKIDPALGILEGRVALSGEPPDLSSKVEVPANHQDFAHCAEHVKDERLLLGKEKALANVVVSIEDYRPRERPEPRIVRMDNKNCLFVPHVLAATLGSTLEITNSDGFIHNSRGLLKPLQGINRAIPPGGSGKFEHKLRQPGWGVMKCDYHPWMQAHVHVFPHELFAITRPDGTFRIVNIPPGTHKVRLWHEVLQNRTIDVKIEAGKTARLDEGLEAYKD